MNKIDIKYTSSFRFKYSLTCGAALPCFFVYESYDKIGFHVLSRDITEILIFFSILALLSVLCIFATCFYIIRISLLALLNIDDPIFSFIEDGTFLRKAWSTNNSFVKYLDIISIKSGEMRGAKWITIKTKHELIKMATDDLTASHEEIIELFARKITAARHHPEKSLSTTAIRFR
jgi:hypothetical protein